MSGLCRTIASPVPTVIARLVARAVWLGLIGILIGCATTAERAADGSSVDPSKVFKIDHLNSKSPARAGIRDGWRPLLELTGLRGLERRYAMEEVSGGRRGYYDSSRKTLKWGKTEFDARPFAEWHSRGEWRWLNFSAYLDPDDEAASAPESDLVTVWRALDLDRDDLLAFAAHELQEPSLAVSLEEAEILGLMISGLVPCEGWISQENGSRRTYFLLDDDLEGYRWDRAGFLQALDVCVAEFGLDPRQVILGYEKSASVGRQPKGDRVIYSTESGSVTLADGTSLTVKEQGTPSSGRALVVDDRWYPISAPTDWGSYPESLRELFESAVQFSPNSPDPGAFAKLFHRTWCDWQSACVASRVDSDRTGPKAEWRRLQGLWIRQVTRDILLEIWTTTDARRNDETSYHEKPSGQNRLERLQVSPTSTGRPATAWQVEADSGWGRVRYHVVRQAKGYRIDGLEIRSPGSEWRQRGL